jgi:ribosome-binding factor A
LRPVFDRSESHSEKPDYKTAALCKQVRRALSLALAGECADEMLQRLIVDEVLPAPNAGRLLVRVVARAAASAASADRPVSVVEILRRLELVRGLLRACVGEAIVRKRTPELAFDVVVLGSLERPPGEEVDHE